MRRQKQRHDRNRNMNTWHLLPWELQHKGRICDGKAKTCQKFWSDCLHRTCATATFPTLNAKKKKNPAEPHLQAGLRQGSVALLANSKRISKLRQSQDLNLQDLMIQTLNLLSHPNISTQTAVQWPQQQSLTTTCCGMRKYRSISNSSLPESSFQDSVDRHLWCWLHALLRSLMTKQLNLHAAY